MAEQYSIVYMCRIFCIQSSVEKATNEQIKQTNRLIDTDDRMVVTRGEEGRGRAKRVKGVMCR